MASAARDDCACVESDTTVTCAERPAATRPTKLAGMTSPASALPSLTAAVTAASSASPVTVTCGCARSSRTTAGAEAPPATAPCSALLALERARLPRPTIRAGVTRTGTSTITIRVRRSRIVSRSSLSQMVMISCMGEPRSVGSRQ